MKKFINLSKECIIKELVFMVIGCIIGWGISWILPAQPVTAKNIPKKELTCTLNYSQKLFTNTNSSMGFKVLYGDKPVEDPYFYSITIKNTGDYAIKNEDFKNDFYIDFVDGTEIIKASVIESSNKYVYDEILQKSNDDSTKIVFSDFFLNPNESFTLSVITDSKASVINYNSRIEGISNLKLINTTAEKIHKNHNRFITFMVVMAILAVVVAVVVVVSHIKYKKREKQFEEKLKK